MTQPITTAGGSTLQLHEDKGRTYVLSSCPAHNEPAFASTLIGEVVGIPNVGPTFVPSRGAQLALSPDVLRATATLIDTLENRA